MRNFNIIKKSKIEKTFRVARIMGDFDLRTEESVEEFSLEFDFPREWQIGLIVGASGTGKTTIMRELFSEEQIVEGFSYERDSVIDDMPAGNNVGDITKMFYAVGFGSVPSWLKPYSVLSNGEKMRVDLARALLEKEFIVFDEFTSVVDRRVAETACIAIEKAVRKKGIKFVGVTCHHDVANYLQPDWIINTDDMTVSFPKAHVSKKHSILKDVGLASGESLKSITI